VTKNDRWVALVLLGLIVLAGGYVRLANLGGADLLPDEIIQYFVAESLARGDGPLLPSGASYTRGIDVTRLVQLSVERLGPTVEAMRLPSALFGILNLLLFAAVLWGFGGPWVAVWGVLLLAVYPEAVQQSRYLRFYTYQLNFGLIALFAGWRALEPARSSGAGGSSSLARQWGWLIVAIAALLMAVRIQVAALSVVLGFGLYAVFSAGVQVSENGRKAWPQNVPLQVVTVGVICVAALVLLRFEWLIAMARDSQLIFEWAKDEADITLAYYYHFVETYPLLVSLIPLVFLIVLHQHGRLGVYLAVWFSLPIVLHSIAFPWKGARFVLLATPALFAAAALAATIASGAIYRFVSRATVDPLGGRFNARARHCLAAIVTAVICLGAVVTTPAFNQTRKTLSNLPPPGWSGLVETLASRPDLSGLPLGHSRNLEPLYYLGYLDFSIARTKLQMGVPRPDGLGYQLIWMPEGSLDYYMGVPVLPSPEAIMQRFGPEGSVLIGLNADAGEPAVDSALLSVLHEEAEELCRGRCGRMELYHWQFGEPGPGDEQSQRSDWGYPAPQG
jgi:hypothetical protein